MNWTCEQIEARLSDYLDGLLDPAESHELNQHVNSCEACSLLFATVSRTLGGLYSLDVVEPPPRLVYAILTQTLGPREKSKGVRGVFDWFGSLLTARFAYGVIAVTATLVVVLAASGFSFRKPKLADLSPVTVYRRADSFAHIAYARSTKFVTDLRVVYEIQSRLSKDSDLPTDPESTLPQPAPGKNPGSTDNNKPGAPKQQNRANGLRREIEVLAALLPAINGNMAAQLTRRSIR
jgi:anti-sigma factor RsiW